jgi:hypothetical protein
MNSLALEGSNTQINPGGNADTKFTGYEHDNRSRFSATCDFITRFISSGHCDALTMYSYASFTRLQSCFISFLVAELESPIY